MSSFHCVCRCEGILIPLRVLALTHTILFCWIFLAPTPGVGAWSLSNSVFLFLLYWLVRSKENPLPTFLCLIWSPLSYAIEITAIAYEFPPNVPPAEGFTVAMYCLNMALRLLTTWCVYFEWKRRSQGSAERPKYQSLSESHL